MLARQKTGPETAKCKGLTEPASLDEQEVKVKKNPVGLL